MHCRTLLYCIQVYRHPSRMQYNVFLSLPLSITLHDPSFPPEKLRHLQCCSRASIYGTVGCGSRATGRALACKEEARMRCVSFVVDSLKVRHCSLETQIKATSTRRGVPSADEGVGYLVPHVHHSPKEVFARIRHDVNSVLQLLTLCLVAFFFASSREQRVFLCSRLSLGQHVLWP